MKKFSIISIGIFAIVLGFLPIAIASAYTSPGKPIGFVNDFAGILSVTEKQDIESKLSALESQTGFEVAVVTVSSLGNETIESYATRLFEDWGIGDAEKDTGILLLVAPNERAVKIETGYGAEGAVTDIQAGNIIRIDILPAFKEGKYATGIAGAVDALTAIIKNSPEAMEYSTMGPGDEYYGESHSKSSGSNFDFGWVIFLFVVVVNVLAKILGKTKSWWLGGVLGAIVGAIIGLIWGFVYVGVVSVVILTILGLIFDFIVSKNPPRSGGHGGFWPIFFGGGRGGSSGFGGFGGGMSGGGGASGRW